MKTTSQYDSALAAEYALGTLRGPARQQFERRLQQEPALQEEVSRWQTMLGHMDHAVQPVVPSADVWQKSCVTCQPKNARGCHTAGITSAGRWPRPSPVR